MKYQNFEVHAQSPSGVVRRHEVGATSAEQAERMVKAMLGPSWRVIATVYQFKLEDDKK